MRKIAARTMVQLLATSAAVTLLAFVLAACTSNPTSNTSSTSVDDVSNKLVSDLGIIAPQSDSVRNTFHRHGIRPDSLWSIAAELENTLTADQKQQLLSMTPQPHGEIPDTSDMSNGCGGDSMHLGRPDHGGPGPHPGFGPPTPQDSAAEFNAMVSALNLTEVQQPAIVALMAQQRAAMDSIMAQLKAGTIDRAAAGAAMDKLRQDRDTALAQILDSTQLEIVKIHDALMARLGPPDGPGHGRHHG